MYLSYVDESGDTGEKGSRHLLLGAAVLFEGRWANARDEIERLLKQYFPTPPRPPEIHCTDIRGGRNAFSKLEKHLRPKLLADFCALARGMLDIELRMFSVIYEMAVWRHRNPSKSGQDLYIEAFEQLVSRIDLFLRRRYAEGKPSKGLLIVDPCNSALSAALKAALGDFQQDGTRWASLYNVIETVMFLNSHESPGLQLADLCSFALWRLVEFEDDSLARQIQSVFDREPPTSTYNAGKWHGVKYFGESPSVTKLIKTVWP